MAQRFILPKLSPIDNFDEPFLLTVYTSTRSKEMAVVSWSEEQKSAFLEMQFQAQHNYYLSRYPNASYSIINLEEQPIGRLYIERQEDKIKILDITVLPEYRNQGVGTKLIAEILQEGEQAEKPVQIYIENYNQSSNLFSRLGFQPVAEEGINVLWQWNPGATSAETKVHQAVVIA
jgi:ribosomal protein S18 acetylase RimI-like enzyme